ncbi:Cmx/CmrA family chloramphenicol efflux MFS transporter [Streptomyces sp. NPDC101160]|uniref:Cmx/CmrA family chloramphenicol efflux MFS transporter n=1 Tax=Streptomyces sp. NPDC101160 TaxID=3366118 RepID=UPI0038076309
MPFFVHVLGLAVLAQGTSEFMLSGLVPGLARDLSVSPSAAAGLTSAYAIGMIAGAPATAALGARWRHRPALAGFLAAFVLVHAVGALTTDFTVLFATRVVAAIVNAGFLAVALPFAASLAGPARQARATAVLLSGVTLSCVVGVPAGAVLGERYGWRWAFWAVAALCLPALALVFRSAPAERAAGRARNTVRVRDDLRTLRSRRLRTTLAVAALVNGATFASFAFLAVIATDVAQLPPAAVPGLLAAFGAGAFLGVTAAGRTAVRTPPALGGLLAGWFLLAATAAHPVPLFLLAAVQGALSFGLGTTLVSRVLSLATDAPSLGGAFATVALNTGAFLGPLLAASVTAQVYGDPRGALWTSAALAATAAAVDTLTRCARRKLP